MGSASVRPSGGKRMVVYMLDMLCWVYVTGRCPGGVDQLMSKQARKERKKREIHNGDMDHTSRPV